jgi:TonB family protein
MDRLWKNNPPSIPHGAIVWLSLGLSVLIHIAIFLALQDAFPLSWISQNMRTYQVELLRPPVEDMEKDPGASAETELDRKDPSEDQETISLDTEDTRYVSYARVIKEHIARKWKYPPEAKAGLVEGKLRILFSLNRTGEMIRIRVLSPSGSSVLDQEAVRAVRAASPYPSFPEQVKVPRLNIEADFEYRLTAEK